MCRRLTCIFSTFLTKKINELGARGIGEIGLAGNRRRYHGSGPSRDRMRVRELPVTLDKLI